MSPQGASKTNPRRGRPRDDIRTKRVALQLSRSDLANEIGSHAQTIEKIESGEITFSRFLPAIERRLGLTKARGTSETASVAAPQIATQMSDWHTQTPTPALDIQGVNFSLARSPDGKRRAFIFTLTLKDGSIIRCAIEHRMLVDALPHFLQVVKTAGIDVSKLSASAPEAE